MNTRNKTIKEILSLYNVILENKNVNEASDVYDNVDFNDTAVRGSKPSRDDINITLLQDIQTAAKKVGLKVDITTAITGHKSGPNTRHDEGNAVDIAVINGKPVSLSNRVDADKLVDELVRMGYVKNKENSSIPKSVLTFGFPNHDNHIHISNITQSPSKVTDTTNSPTDTETPNFARQIGKSLLNAIGIKESLDYTSLGKKTSLRFGDVVIPKKENSNIKSPVSGVVSKYFNDCDGLTIKFESEGETLYLNYCGIEPSRFRVGQKIKKGEVIGSPDSDVNVSLLNSNGYKQKINSNKKTDSGKGLSSLFRTNSKPTTYPDKSNSKDYSRYDSEIGRELIKLKDNLFSISKKDKLDENINRIKDLL
jgi:hypothetical protein